MAFKRIKTEYCDITLKDMSKEVKKQILKAMRTGFREAGVEYRRQVKATVKSKAYKTGKLHKSIGYKLESTGSGEPWLKIGAKNGGKAGGANHAHLVENGTGPRWNKKQKHSTGRMPALPFLKNLDGNIAKNKVEQQLKGIGGW